MPNSPTHSRAIPVKQNNIQCSAIINISCDYCNTVFGDCSQHSLQNVIVDYDVQGTDTVEVSPIIAPHNRGKRAGQENQHPDGA